MTTAAALIRALTQTDRCLTVRNQKFTFINYTVLQPTMQIRNADTDDLEQIVAIYNQAVTEGNCTADTEPLRVSERQEWFAQHSAEHYPIFVMADEKNVGGWCSLSAHRPGRKALQYVAEISYYVGLNYRGKGIGQRLMEHALRTAPTIGLHNLFAILLDSNQLSVYFLEQNGFKQWGHLPDIAEFPDSTCGQFIYGRKV